MSGGPPDARMRVLLLMERLTTGGSERRFLRLANGLPRDRFDVRIGVLQPGGDLVGEFAKTGLPIIPFYRRWRFDFSPATRLAAYCRAEDIAVIHAMHWLSGTFAAQAAQHLPRTAAIGSTVGRIYDVVSFSMLRAWNDRRLSRHVGAMVVNSASLRDYLLAHHYPAERIIIIPNGVSLPDLATRPAQRAALRQQYSIPADAPCVGILARLEAVKDHATFVRAASIVSAQHPAARFMIAGEGAERARLDALVAELGIASQVIFTGNVAGAEAVMAAWDVAVLCSLHEGLPNAILETMAWGLPVVATRVGGIPDLVADGVTGLLVPPGDAAALAAALGALIADPDRAQTLGAAGRQRVADQWSVAQMVDRYANLYLKCERAKRGE